jgi:hypothetical protein
MTTILDNANSLETILRVTLEALDKRRIKHTEIDDIEAGSGMATVTMIATDSESLTAFIHDSAHVFYRWDYTINEDGEKESKGLLQLFALQDGMLYKWELCTTEWAIEQQGDAYDLEQHRLDPIRGVSDEVKVLVDLIENHPEKFTETYVEAAVKGFADNDLTGNYHQIRHIANNTLGTHDIPYRTDAYTALQEMQPDLKRAVEERLEAKRGKAIVALVKTFPRWYREQGSPRMSRNLVKAFAQEQGFRFGNQFVDDLKVQIDIAIARAT